MKYAKIKNLSKMFGCFWHLDSTGRICDPEVSVLSSRISPYSMSSDTVLLVVVVDEMMSRGFRLDVLHILSKFQEMWQKKMGNNECFRLFSQQERYTYISQICCHRILQHHFLIE